MSYRIHVKQIDAAGIPERLLALYEAETEMEAVTIATYEVGVSRPGHQRIATVFAPSGLLILAYVGCATAGVGDERR